jgi:hypothetical protein
LRAQLKRQGGTVVQGGTAAQRGTAPEAIATRLKELDEQLDLLLESAASTQYGGAKRGLTRVNGEIAGLYAQAEATDAAPTQAQRSAATSLLNDWQALVASSAKIWQDLAAVNQALTQAKLPILRSDAQAPEEGESDNEE